MTTVNTTRLSNSSDTQFEDISNEIIYEIFDFLDMYDVYQAFSDLNIRFHNLIHCSSLPLNINMSFLSKLDLQNYSTQFILPNINRINSIRLNGSSMFKHVFSSPENIKKFIGIKSLILDVNISENILYRLISLPNLSSLIINYPDCATTGYIDCQSIISLPKLKYCKISYKGKIYFGLSHDILNVSSSIEHLVINGQYNLNELPKLLLLLPHLSRLSINYLYRSSDLKLKVLPQILNQSLTHVNLTLKHIQFDRFEPFILNLFHNVQVFRISMNDDIQYLSANRWERIISSSMPNLRIFDIQHLYIIPNEHDQLVYDDLIKQFTSSFWVQRRWYFQQQRSEEISPNYGLFFSIQPYMHTEKNELFFRRRDYILYGKYNQDNQVKNNYHFVRHVHIHNQSVISDRSIFFPNADELTISFDYSRSCYLQVSSLSQCIPLEGIHKITINSNRFHIVTLIQMLSSTPNCSQLILKSLLLENIDSVSIRQTTIFSSVSNTNKITDIIFKSICTFKQLELLIKLCPRVQQLNISVSQQEFTSIIKYLFAKSNKNTRHLVSLYIQNSKDIYVEKLMNLLEPLKRSGEFVIENIGYLACHIWW